MVTLKQYNDSTVQPTDDAVLYDTILGTAGVAQGALCTIIGANQIRISAGRVMIKGRMVEVDNELVTAALSTSGNKQGRLILRVDMANTEKPAYFTTQVGAPLPALVQEDINTDGLIYEFAMATYTAGDLAISDIKDVAYRFSRRNDYQNLPGLITQWPGQTAPEGYLLCQGQAVSRTTYASLFAAIGTAFGQGNGSSTFNVPDMTGRVALGASGTHALASTGGEETHLLTLSEAPSHRHDLDWAYAKAWGVYGRLGYVNEDEINAASNNVVHSSGGDEAHNNMQPYVAMQYIIKY